MGWSSWNTYRVNISEELIKKQASLMVELGLDKCGYRYVNIDDGYFGGRDAGGKLKTHPQRFPNGLKGVVDHIHGLRLKAGIYSDAGEDTCGCFWDKDVLGSGVGLYKHEKQDAEFFFNELGFDFIKIDFCGGDRCQNAKHLSLDERDRYTAIRKAIDSVKPGVRINVCRWNYPGTWVREIGSSWRISADINPTWGRVKAIIKENLYLSAYAAPGAYNDMDMLEVGRGFTDEEDQTHFAVWCLMSSPLLIGCDLEQLKSKPKTLALLKNTDLIALDQDTAAPQAYVAERNGDAYVLVRDLEKPFGTVRAVAFVNLEDKEKKLMAAFGPFGDLDLDGKLLHVRDLTAQRDLTEAEIDSSLGDSSLYGLRSMFYVTVPPHGTRIFRVEAEKRLERTRYEAETAFLPTYQKLHDAKKVKTAYYEKKDNAAGGMVVTGAGGRKDNFIVWERVWSENGGEYRMSVVTAGEGGTVAARVNGIVSAEGAKDEKGVVNFRVELKPGLNEVCLFNDSEPLPAIDRMWIIKSLELSRKEKIP
ncbi:MAG: alpha-galactosidase [Kiritimatiellae bacterium]|nr:alpha-galactosidase [Kiritimatiellia bacterium]